MTDTTTPPTQRSILMQYTARLELEKPAQIRRYLEARGMNVTLQTVIGWLSERRAIRASLVPDVARALSIPLPLLAPAVARLARDCAAERRAEKAAG